MDTHTHTHTHAPFSPLSHGGGRSVALFSLLLLPESWRFGGQGKASEGESSGATLPVAGAGASLCSGVEKPTSRLLQVKW